MSPKKIRAVVKKGTRSGKNSSKKKMKEVRNGVRKNERKVLKIKMHYFMDMDLFIIIMTIDNNVVDTNLIIVSQTYGKSCIKF